MREAIERVIASVNMDGQVRPEDARLVLDMALEFCTLLEIVSVPGFDFDKLQADAANYLSPEVVMLALSGRPRAEVGRAIIQQFLQDHYNQRQEAQKCMQH